MSPTTSNTPRLGDLERAVMEHLWASRAEHPAGATVREVRERTEEGTRDPGPGRSGVALSRRGLTGGADGPDHAPYPR